MKKQRWISLGAILACALGIWFWLRWLERSYDEPFCEVEAGLTIGRSVKKPPLGTKAVVNLCGQKDLYDVEESLWEPVFEGGKEPDLKWLTRVVAFIASQRKANRPTYVHCLAGMNRSGAIVTAYLMYEHGWERDKALSFVQERRPVVQPNPTLMRLLADWETALKEKRAADK